MVKRPKASRLWKNSKWAMLLFLFVCDTGVASPFHFEESGVDAQEYVVDCITNEICSSEIVLMQHRWDEDLRNECGYMPWFYPWELGLKILRCVDVLKGRIAPGGYTVTYLYRTPRMCFELPIVQSRIPFGPRAGEFCYIDREKRCRVWEKGKAFWRFEPPYDPYADPDSEEYVKLMFVRPENRIDMRRIKLDPAPLGTNTIARVVKGDVHAKPPEELMEELGVANVYSNRVFRMTEGCVFQVDYPVPELDWRSRLESPEQHREQIARNRKMCKSLMHLSSDEVSEIVWLAYLLEGDRKGFESACRRCPRILHPVPELKTKIGRMVQDALMAAGRLQEMH